MMSSKASFVLVFFALAFLLSSAAESPAELYWKSKLGNLPMPKVLKNSLHDGSNDGIVKLNSHFQVPLDQHILPLADIKYGVYINYAHPTLGDRDEKSHFARPSDKLQAPVDGREIYFTNEKLYTPGIKMKLHFNNIDNGAKFLPLRVAKSIVVASNKSEMVLNILSVNPKSVVAQYIKQTFKDCKEKGIKDEVRYCATSLEAMVDFITLGSNSTNNRLMVVSTEQEKDNLMEYTIQKAQKLGNDDNHTVVCHKLNNPYVVFLCHNIRSTDVYGVSLVGVDGKQMKAIVVCHKDTSNWYPQHLAFQLLKLKPGGEPVCHFLSGDTVIWLRT